MEWKNWDQCSDFCFRIISSRIVHNSSMLVVKRAFKKT